MKKFLIIIALFVAPAHAVKLCGRTCTWNSGSSVKTMSCSTSGNYTYCTCYVIITTSSCTFTRSWSGGRWQSSFPGGCGMITCPSVPSCNSGCSCSGSGSGGWSSDVNPAAITCPENGECENSDYKTVGDDESCGDGYSERTAPTLTITGTYSDDAGTFTYGECTK